MDLRSITSLTRVRFDGCLGLVETTHKHTEHTDGLGPQGVQQITHVSRGRIRWSLDDGGMEGVIWTRENVVGKVFPHEDQGDRGITVLWPAELHWSASVA